MNVELMEVALHNFLSHKRTEIRFGRGITVLVGPNGAGKTSVIEAVAFALTGDALNRKKRRELINKQSITATVRVRFKAYNKEYLIERKIMKDKGGEVKLYVRQDNAFRLYAMKKGEVENELKRILGVDVKILKEIAFVAQGEVTKLLESTPKERGEIISKIVGITMLKNAKDEMRHVINFWSKKKVKMEGEINELKAKIKEKEKLIDIIKRSEEELRRLQRELKEKENELKEIRLSLDALEKIAERWTTLNERRNALIEEISRLESELSKIKDVDVDKIRREINMLENLVERKSEVYAKVKELERKRRLEDELKKIEDNIRALKSKAKRYERARGASERYEELSKKYVSLSSLIRYVNQAREILEAGFKRLEDVDYRYLEVEEELEEVEEAIDALNAELGSLKRKIEEGENKLKVLREGDRCPICGRPLTKDHIKKLRIEIKSEISEAEKKMEEIMKELNKLKERREKLAKEIKRLEVLHKYAQTLMNAKVSPEDVLNAERKMIEIENEMRRLERLKDEEKRLERINKELDTLMKLRNEIMNELDRIAVDYAVKMEFEQILKAEKKLKSLREEYEKAKEMRVKRQELLSMLSQYKEQLISIEKELNSINYDVNKHEELEKKYEKLIEDVSSLQGKMSELEKKISELKERTKDINELREKLKGMEVEVKKINKFISLLETVRGKLDKAQELTLERVRALTEKYMKEMIETFSFDFYDVILDRDFGVKIITQRGDMEVSQLSGGEKVALGIALRLALTKALGERVGFIFLDEPTIHLDTERRRGLVNIFQNMSSDMPIAQMILVTHDRELIDAADYVCEVERVGGFSKVSCSSLS